MILCKKSGDYMICTTINNYMLCFKNPFTRYILDLDKVGTLDIVKGLISRRIHTYHLNRISELQFSATALQRIFRTGTIKFNVHEYNQVSKVCIENVKCAEDIYSALSYYKQSIIKK